MSNVPSLPPPPPRGQTAPPPPLGATYPQYAAPPVHFNGGQVSMQSNGLPAGVSPVSPMGRLGSYLLQMLLMVVTLGIGWLIWAAIIAGKGQTPAKQLLGQRVIGLDTKQPVGFARMFFMRGIVAGFVAQFAIAFTLGILLFMPFWDKNNQNLWDKVSGTAVVRDPNDAWNTQLG
jgi:uncharacterized RDD family membrane protein YckC